MTTATKTGRKTASVHGLKAVGDPADGIFEAYVSVFLNTDFQGDRIMPGAFAGTLERWKASGDPIPVIFSHQWDNLDAHIGKVLDAEEHLPGDARLAGTGLEANGGLWSKFQIDMSEDFASRVAKRLTDRRIKEFSFAYDVLDEQRGTDGVNELLELDLLEEGPTLKGANPATVLLSKAIGDDVEGMTEDVLLDRLAKAVAARSAKSSVPVTFDGAVEHELEAIFAAAHAWAAGGNIGAGGFYALHQEATYLDEGRVVVLVEGWEDPYGEGVFYELNYAKDADGAVTVSDPHELEVSVELSRKARSKKLARSFSAEKTAPVAVVTGPAAEPDPTAIDDEILRGLDEALLEDLESLAAE